MTPTPLPAPKTIHSAFCAECGAWNEVHITTIAPHESRISCASCGEGLLIIRTVEP